jgi:acid phosphatase family membrane protein YuiD
LPYFLAPFIGWLVSGTIKYVINSARYGSEAKQRIGNGGFPSTHTTVMATPTMLIGINEGFLSPIFGLAVAITYIVTIDAMGLRIAVGKQARIVNQLAKQSRNPEEDLETLRESMGHSKFEVIGGVVLGTVLAFILNGLFSII